LAREVRPGVEAVDSAASELGLSRRQVYVLLRRWREGDCDGVVSDLLPRRSSGGRGRGWLPVEVEALLAEVIRQRPLGSSLIAVQLPWNSAG
jgi:putative transposase